MSPLMTALLYAHLGTLLLGFIALTLTAAASLLYFVKHQELKAKRFSTTLQNLPSLQSLDVLALRALTLSTVLLTIANVTGITVAHVTDPKGNWIHAPKFILAIATWCWFLFLLFIRKRFGFRGIKFFSLVVLGFLILVATFISAIWRPIQWN